MYQSWVDEIDIIVTPGEIHLLSITPDGPMHELFTRTKPVLAFAEGTSDVALSFEYLDEIVVDSAGDWALPSYVGVSVASMGKDPTNIIYEPVDRYFESNYLIEDYSQSDFVEYQIVEHNTVFIKLPENKFARMHFAGFEYDIYGNLIKIKLYVAYKNNGSAHFERLTTP